MGLKDLEKFLADKKEQKVAVPPIDWKQEKQRWLHNIDEYYSRIEEWLVPYKAKDLLQYNFEEITLSEEDIGEYKTRRLHLEISNDSVVFEPIGTNLIGAYGRIDMVGKNGTIKFIVVDKDSTGPRISVKISQANDLKKTPEVETLKKEIELAWKIIVPPPNIKYIDLNADSFSDALLEVTK
ncbi:MAG: hypothetical protein WA131_04810 [Desulfitobacteriaceae bacterium]